VPACAQPVMEPLFSLSPRCACTAPTAFFLLPKILRKLEFFCALGYLALFSPFNLRAAVFSVPSRGRSHPSSCFQEPPEVPSAAPLSGEFSTLRIFFRFFPLFHKRSLANFETFFFQHLLRCGFPARFSPFPLFLPPSPSPDHLWPVVLTLTFVGDL